MEKENQETEKEVNNDLPKPQEESINTADYYRKNPNINKRNAVTIIMPNREKFIEIKTIVEEAKKDDPSYTEGRLFMDALAYCQSQGFYIVNTHNNGKN
jgi:uncharacterized Rmd1/YagE family protein